MAGIPPCKLPALGWDFGGNVLGNSSPWRKWRAFPPVNYLDLAGILQAMYQETQVPQQNMAGIPPCKLPAPGWDLAGNVPGNPMPGTVAFRLKKMRAFRPRNDQNLGGIWQAMYQEVQCL